MTPGATVREKRPCPEGVCDGSGWLLDDDSDEARECSCRPRRMQARRMKGIAKFIPPRYRGASFDRPPVSDMAADAVTKVAVEQVREYADAIEERIKAGAGLWLFGETGTGKTTLGMLVARLAIEAGHTVGVYTLPELLARIRRTYDGDGDSYTEFFNRLVEVDLLYLDDLGSEKRTEWVLEQLYAIVNRRYEHERSTMVTTNLLHDELEEQIGARTVSRLKQLCEEVPVFGADARYGRLGAVE